MPISEKDQNRLLEANNQGQRVKQLMADLNAEIEKAVKLGLNIEITSDVVSTLNGRDLPMLRMRPPTFDLTTLES